jgi:CPA1 family monovalent cation:H+ antiporter
MEATVLKVAALFAVVAVIRAIARRVQAQDTLVLLVIGAVLSYVPGIPVYHVRPDLILMVVLPVLLYAAAFTTSLPAFRTNIRSIVLMAVGVTLFSTVAVGYVGYLIIPELSLAAAMVLGAVVSPADAVAATTIGRRAGMPSRAITVLEGESLFNDAAALTVFQVAVAAMVTGTFGFTKALQEFAVAAVGGLAVGVVVMLAIGFIRNRIDNPYADTALSLLAPFAAFLPANAFGGSGLAAVVVTGLYLGHRAPTLMDAQARLVTRSVWQIIEYLLSGVVFLLIGLQLSHIIHRLGSYPAGLLAIASAGVVATMVVARIVWVFGADYLPRLLIQRVRKRTRNPSWRGPAIVSWAGLRGVVSLAAAFAIPNDAAGHSNFPARDLVQFLAFVAIAATLIGQGLTLPAVVRKLHAPRTEATSPAEQLRLAHRASAEAELGRLDELLEDQEPHPEVVDRIRQRIERRRSLTEPASDDEQNSDGQESARDAYARLRLETLSAARNRLITLRDDKQITEGIFRQTQQELDLEEAMLRRR